MDKHGKNPALHYQAADRVIKSGTSLMTHCPELYAYPLDYIQI